jgi:hypothetical protein
MSTRASDHSHSRSDAPSRAKKAGNAFASPLSLEECVALSADRSPDSSLHPSPSSQASHAHHKDASHRKLSDVLGIVSDYSGGAVPSIAARLLRVLVTTSVFPKARPSCGALSYQQRIIWLCFPMIPASRVAVKQQKSHCTCSGIFGFGCVVEVTLFKANVHSRCERPD